MAITNATRLSDFAAGIGTEGAILKIDNANQSVGIGTQFPSQTLDVVGVVTATAFHGDGSLLEGIKSAGLGTAVGDSNTVEEVVYYTDDLLTVNETTTINPPASASAAYTQYRDIKLDDNVDLIIETGDDFIPDILGLGTAINDVTAAGNGVFDEVYADIIKNKNGLGAPALANGLTSVGVITATGGFSGNVTGNVTGSGANLTNIPAGQLTGALPALDGSALTGVGLGPTDSYNTSGIITATTFVPTVGQLSHRNIIINGAMNVAQRGTSSTLVGYQTVDRIATTSSGLDESPTYAQADVSSGTTPYTLGFRKAFKVTNGNQTSGAGAADRIRIYYGIEAQDLAQSGWNYTSSSSYVTASFWVKSSVAQNFYGYFRMEDGTQQSFAYETGALSANTWKKVIIRIPGNSNITINNDNGVGAYFFFVPFQGTDFTASSVSLNTWAAYASATRTPDATSTWFTTNDATFEITGFQLEVGSVATPFEHRSYGEELLRCQRYFQIFGGDVAFSQFGNGVWKSNTAANCNLQLMTTMRAAPTMTVANPAEGNIRSGGNNRDSTTIVLDIASPKMIMYNANAASGGTDGHGAAHFGANNTDQTLSFSSEL